MAGRRALTESEISDALRVCVGPFRDRDRLMVLLGRYSGFRLREMLSLRIGDIVEGKVLATYIRVKRANLKGGKPMLNEAGEVVRASKISGRSVPMHSRVADALARWLQVLREDFGWIEREAFLFQSRSRINAAISTTQAWRRLADIFQRAGIRGPVASHSLRKTFARDVFEKLGRDIFLTQHALGHRNPMSTVRYLELDEKRIDRAVLDL